MAKVPDTQENMMKCICGNCPTYKSSECPKEKMEGLYCAKGISACDMPEKGCICGECPLWTEHSLSRGYFCISGAAE